MGKPTIRPTAIVSETAKIGEGTVVWEFAQIRENAVIGKNCVIGNGVYIDRGVVIGNNVTINNKSCLYRNLVVEDDVFIGPLVCFTNDNMPVSGKHRELTGKIWHVRKGAAIGGNSTLLPDINIGRYAFVGAGSVVTRDVPDHQWVYGNPARFANYGCQCRKKAEVVEEDEHTAKIWCEECKMAIRTQKKP